MSDPVKDAIKKKNAAKTARRSDPPDLATAAKLLEEAISKLEGVPIPPAPSPLGKLQKDTALELADCWGSLGGTYRAWHKLGQAYNCYNKGLRYESDPRLPPNSYNLVNRLLVRLAMSPEEAHESQFETGTLGEELHSARLEVGRQAKGPRKGDMWAHADSLMLGLLEVDPPAARKTAWTRFDKLAILEYAYTTTGKVLEDLCGRQSLTSEQRKALKEALKWFEDAIRRKAWIKT